jgi:BRCA1-associated protein
MVLVAFRNQESADEFYRAYNNSQYNSIEPDLCRLAYVHSVQTMGTDQVRLKLMLTDVLCVQGGGSALDGHTELPTCTVCLERMDESVESILTILCNHSFHGDCLAKWGDTRWVTLFVTCLSVPQFTLTCGIPVINTALECSKSCMSVYSCHEIHL